MEVGGMDDGGTYHRPLPQQQALLFQVLSTVLKVCSANRCCSTKWRNAKMVVASGMLS